MKQRLGKLFAGMLASLMAIGMLPATVVALKPTPPKVTPLFSPAPYVGTVVISKKGYQNVRKSPTDSTIIFRVHYGERYLCAEDAGDGWYKIMVPVRVWGYVSAKPDDTTFLKDVIDGDTLSRSPRYFTIRTTKKAYLFSQPKTSAKTRRITNNNASELTFYYRKGAELQAFGKTTRGGKDWYLLVVINNGVREIGWLLADTCEILTADPDIWLVPSEWYD